MTSAERDALFARVFATPAGRALLAAERARGRLAIGLHEIDARIGRERERWAGRAPTHKGAAAMTTPNLIRDLRRDEGLRLSAYQDTRGVWTVGYGHAFVHPGAVWTAEQAVAQLQADVDHTEASLDVQLPWWRKLDDVRQDVIAEAAFNMGVTHLAQFHNTLAAVQRGDWRAAHDGLLASLWAAQVGARAIRLADQMLTGVHVGA